MTRGIVLVALAGSLVGSACTGSRLHPDVGSPGGGGGLGTAGTTSTAGNTSYSGGTAGSDYGCQAPVRAHGDAPLIDDFEDGDSRLLPADGRNGGTFYRNWAPAISYFGFGPDLHGGLLPTLIPAGRGASRYAMMLEDIRSEPFVYAWTLAISLTNAAVLPNITGSAPRSCYDASAYGGIAFWILSTTPVAVSLVTPKEVTQAQGGECQKNCWILPSVNLEPSSDWQRVELPWSSFGAVDISELNGITFSGTCGSTGYAMWVDDPAFLPPQPDAGTDAGAGGTDGGAPDSSVNGGSASSRTSGGAGG